MYNTFKDTDPLPRDPSLIDYGFNIDGPDFEELFSPSKIPVSQPKVLVKEEEEEKQPQK